MNAAAKHRAASARRQQRRHPARAAMHWSGPRLFRAGESEPCVKPWFRIPMMAAFAGECAWPMEA